MVPARYSQDFSNTTLLQTKLHQPHVHPQFMPRPHFWERLDQGLDNGLILVSAGAGYGKTTLISSWLGERANNPGEHHVTLPAAWLSLDENDSHLELFLFYCGTALRTIFPGACAETFALLQAPLPVPPSTLIATLINDLEDLPEDFILVLDDYHTIQGEAVPDLLASFVQHWPHRLHLILITRHNPPLPIAALRAKGKITEFRARDLRFTSEEIRQYASRVMKEPLDQPVLQELEQQTEGWIAGLYLYTLALRQRGIAGTLTTFTEAGRNIADYLMDEVLSQQPADISQFLLKTSILECWCIPLCAQVMGDESTERGMQRCLEWLERTNFFTIQLDDRREWHRYHHLLREMLHRRARIILGADQIIELHRRAAAWFEQQGLVEEALHHLLEIHDFDQAERLVQQALREVLNREDRSTLERWVSLFPEDFIQQSPWLLIMKCSALQFMWQLGAIPPLLKRIEVLLENRTSEAAIADLPILRGLVLALKGELAFFENQMEQCAADEQEAMVLLPESWTYARGGYMLFLGLSMQELGQGQIIDRQLWKEYESLPEKTNAYAVRLLFPLCVNEVQAGRLEQSRQRGELMLEQATRGGLPVLQGWGHFWLGMIYYSWNDLTAAARHFQAVADQKFSVQVLAARHSLMGLVLVRLAQDDRSTARSTLETLAQYEVDIFGTETDATRSLRAHLQFNGGERSSAWRWADAFTGPVLDRPLLWMQEEQVTRAYLLISRGRQEDIQTAQQIIDSVLEIAEKTHNTRFTIILTILRALAIDLQGQMEAALETMRHAIDLARPGGFIRFFVDYGLLLQTPLARLAERYPADDFICQILAAFPAQESRHPVLDSSVPSLPIEGLTSREADVLLLMRERLSDKEIARKMSLSPATVKRHAANIYQKLGVRRRWDAVAKAEALHLLSQR
jgi:LuxR family transcriptional regulator, maltose regulon positive regulatory protein